MEILLNVIYVLGFALYIYIGTKFIKRQGSNTRQWYEYIMVLIWPAAAILVALLVQIRVQMRTATIDGKYETKFREVEEVMRKNGISIIDDQIHFDDGKIFILSDTELCLGFSPDIVSIPREDESSVLILQEYLD